MPLVPYRGREQLEAVTRIAHCCVSPKANTERDGQRASLRDEDFFRSGISLKARTELRGFWFMTEPLFDAIGYLGWQMISLKAPRLEPISSPPSSTPLLSFVKFRAFDRALKIPFYHPVAADRTMGGCSYSRPFIVRTKLEPFGDLTFPRPRASCEEIRPIRKIPAIALGPNTTRGPA